MIIDEQQIMKSTVELHQGRRDLGLSATRFNTSAQDKNKHRRATHYTGECARQHKG